MKARCRHMLFHSWLKWYNQYISSFTRPPWIFFGATFFIITVTPVVNLSTWYRCSTVTDLSWLSLPTAFFTRNVDFQSPKRFDKAVHLFAENKKWASVVKGPTCGVHLLWIAPFPLKWLWVWQMNNHALKIGCICLYCNWIVRENLWKVALSGRNGNLIRERANCILCHIKFLLHLKKRGS